MNEQSDIVVLVSLYISADTPDEVCAAIPLRWNKTWRRGENNGRRTYDDSGCLLERRIKSPENPAGALTELLALLLPYREQLVNLASDERVSVEAKIAIYARGNDRPPCHVPRSLVRELAQIDANLDIDLYWLPDDD